MIEVSKANKKRRKKEGKEKALKKQNTHNLFVQPTPPHLL